MQDGLRNIEQDLKYRTGKEILEYKMIRGTQNQARDREKKIISV